VFVFIVSYYFCSIADDSILSINNKKRRTIRQTAKGSQMHETDNTAKITSEKEFINEITVPNGNPTRNIDVTDGTNADTGSLRIGDLWGTFLINRKANKNYIHIE
jgi:hypothetical protein